MKKITSLAIPGRDIALSIPLAPARLPCRAAIDGLRWYRDGGYRDTLQTALLFDGAVNPKLTTARLLGETCGLDISWSAIWENADGGDDGAPLVYPLGADLDVVAALDTKSGLLTVRAKVGVLMYGPIDLLLLPGCAAVYYEN